VPDNNTIHRYLRHESVGGRLRRERMRRGWSQQRLARAIRLAAQRLDWPLPPNDDSLASMISRWERNRHLPDAVNRRLLATALDVPIEALGLTVNDDPDLPPRA
jgi:transcriptional regulator with XRE-family HTH domain